MQAVQVPLSTQPVPLFPLPGAFLFPGQLLPLHIFEPRYRQMIEDCLDGPGRIVIGTIRRDEQQVPGEPPAVLRIAGIGEIVRHEKLPDGRFHIWLLGLTRVCIDEVPSEHPYRLVHCTQFHEVPVPESVAFVLGEQLRTATSQRIRRNLQLPEGTPTGLLADLLVQMLQAPQGVVEDLFVESSVAERARKALVAHERFPPPAEAEAEKE
jgi:Lon protease-like protein